MILHELLQEFGHIIWLIHGLKLINIFLILNKLYLPKKYLKSQLN